VHGNAVRRLLELKLKPGTATVQEPHAILADIDVRAEASLAKRIRAPQAGAAIARDGSRRGWAFVLTSASDVTFVLCNRPARRAHSRAACRIVTADCARSAEEDRDTSSGRTSRADVRFDVIPALANRLVTLLVASRITAARLQEVASENHDAEAERVGRTVTSNTTTSCSEQCD